MRPAPGPARARSRPSAQPGQGSTRRRSTSAAAGERRCGRAPGRPRAVRCTAGAPATHRPQPQRVLVARLCLGGVQPCARTTARKRRSKSMRGWRIRGGAVFRAHAHRSCSQSSPSERPWSPLQVQDMPAESARASTRCTHSTGDDHDESSSQPMHIGCYTCCHRVALLWHAIGALPEPADLIAAPSRKGKTTNGRRNSYVSGQRPLLLPTTPPAQKPVAHAQVLSTASYLPLGTHSKHATRPSNRCLTKRCRVSEW